MPFEEKQKTTESMGLFRNFLLDSLPEESREKLLENVAYTTLPKNKYIFREGEPADYICVIRRGKVKLSHIDPEGRESIVMILSENDTIWESLFLYDGRFPYSAITMTEVQLCRIYRGNFLHVLDNPSASLQIVTLLSQKLHDANERNHILAKTDPAARVAGFLLYTGEREGSDVISLKLEDIASSIGLRPETVSRKLAEMRKLGYVERVGNGKLRILDYASLHALFKK